MPPHKQLRSGVTTGASAAAAAKAAASAFFLGLFPAAVSVVNPAGKEIKVPIHRYYDLPGGKGAAVIKDGGDDPDVTHGLEIKVAVAPAPQGVITLLGGEGVGIVTRPGLQVAVGQPAINPIPEQMIKTALAQVLPPEQGCTATISVPGGLKAAERTLNPRMGIVGGISILGTSGIVRPMSEEAFKDSLAPQLDLALAAGFKSVVLTPGRMGWRNALQYHLPESALVEMSNFVGFMLDACVEKGINKVLLWGHYGKLIKVAAGIFHTHSRIADARGETMAALAASLGAGPATVRAIMSCNTTEAMMQILAEHNLPEVLDLAARRASARAAEYAKGRLIVGTALLSMDGRLVAADRQAQAIGSELGWLVSQ
ncbi:MAG: cobalt-precorrin-5B (C(1))-methyltransferase CbiD [Firmicutes bacterium]|nr:cobalt-precorrin-5B (C(1))-methyltransferase CbiD [Bacillota bacterium]